MGYHQNVQFDQDFTSLCARFWTPFMTMWISYVAEIRKQYGPTTTSMNGPGNHFVNLFLLGKSVAPILLKSCCCWYFDDAIQLLPLL